MLDVIAVVDGSDSIYDDDYIRLKRALEFIAKNLDIRTNGARMGIVVYSTDIALRFNLTSNLNDILTQITNLPHPKDGTLTHEGIKAMRKMFLGNKRDQSQHEVPLIGIVITDGKSKFPKLTRNEAAASKQHSINMYAVGIGHGIHAEELEAIASNTNQVLQVNTFEALLMKLESLVKMVCPSKHFLYFFIKPLCMFQYN